MKRREFLKIACAATVGAIAGAKLGASPGVLPRAGGYSFEVVKTEGLYDAGGKPIQVEDLNEKLQEDILRQIQAYIPPENYLLVPPSSVELAKRMFPHVKVMPIVPWVGS